MNNIIRRLTPAERRLRRISRLVAGMPEEVLRGLLAETLLGDGEIFRWLNEDVDGIAGKFVESWERFQDYGREGHFE